MTAGMVLVLNRSSALRCYSYPAIVPLSCPSWGLKFHMQSGPSQETSGCKSSLMNTEHPAVQLKPVLKLASHRTDISHERWEEWRPGSLEGMEGSKDNQGLRGLEDTEVLWEGWPSHIKPAWTRCIYRKTPSPPSSGH